MSMLHSKLGASSMHRWSVCPGSIKLSEKAPPSISSKYAEEGTKAHEAAAYFLSCHELPADADAETAQAIMVYINAIFEDERRSGTYIPHRLVEHKFDLSKVYPGLFGTADCVLYHAEQKLLRVYDYKHGAGIPVDVENNVQLMYYGLGALVSLNYLVETVELIIVQPRCPHPDGQVRRWRLPAIDMFDFAADLVAFAKNTEKENAPLVPGDHCRFCPAAGICPKVHEKALTLAKEEFRLGLSYDPAKLGQVLHWLPTLEGWIKSVREFAYGEAEHGRTPPGWKLVQKRSTRKWRDIEEAKKFIFSHFMDSVSRDCVTDPELKSPAQIEKILGTKYKDQIADLIVAESSGCTLAPDNDKRESIKLDAKTEFGVATLFE